MTKVCSKCGQEKGLEGFTKCTRNKSGYASACLECKRQYYIENREKILQHQKKYYEANKEVMQSRQKEYDGKHKQKIKEYKASWYQEHKAEMTEKYRGNNAQWARLNPGKRRQSSNDWKKRNRVQVNEYQNKRRLSDPCIKMRSMISHYVCAALKNNNGGKRGLSCMKFLPYTIQQLREHLERQFDEYMSWENHGLASTKRYTWHIDHIIPQSALPYDSMEHPNFQKCWALENLRPLRAIDNIRKGNKVTQEPSINGD